MRRECEQGFTPEPLDGGRLGLRFPTMGGRRVFVSGVGSELGTLVASMLEAEPWVGSLSGIDADPPRRRLPKTEFHRVPPDQHDRIVDIISRFNPHVLVHIGVWEPDARASPKVARHLTDQAATSIIGAAAECPALENVIVRSGIEIYGRGRGALTRPDETAEVRPTSEWGRTLGRDRTHRITGREPGRREHRRRAPRSRARPPRAVTARTNVAHAGRAVLPARRSPVRGDPGSRRRTTPSSPRPAQNLAQPVNVVASGAITCLQAIRRGRRSRSRSSARNGGWRGR